MTVIELVRQTHLYVSVQVKETVRRALFNPMSTLQTVKIGTSSKSK